MRWVRLVISVFLQLMFGCFAAGGLAGLIALFLDWRKNKDNELGVLAVVGILCASAIFVGAKGIVVTRKRAREDVTWNPYAQRSAVANIVSGALLLAVGIGFTLISYRSARQGDGIYVIALGPIVVGAAQLLTGSIQVVRLLLTKAAAKLGVGSSVVPPPQSPSDVRGSF
jgi:hypothetical protein